MADVAAGADVVGSPAMPLKEYFRQVAVLRRMAGRKPAAADKAPGSTAGNSGDATPDSNRTTG
jgi:UDP-3-O-[3-hydroxymyristoyl] glucosamine N-acyltransferase